MAQPNLTTYGGILRDPGYEGGQVNQNPFQSITMVNDQPTPIFPGRFVARSAADDTCKAPATDADVLCGFSIRFPIMTADYLTDVMNYKQFAALPVAYDDTIYAIPSENVNRGDRVVNITATNRAGSAATAAAGAGRVLAGECTWETTTAAGTLGKIKVVFKP